MMRCAESAEQGAFMSQTVRRLRRLGGVAVAGSLLTAFAVVSGPAEAFKPFTHNETGFSAYDDAVDDGMVTINGQTYAVSPTLVSALQAWPSYYNAGVIGPDGFPDLVMGQSIIHPVETGDWLAYVLDKAWDAQSDPAYNAVQRGQILAFAYGYLTHAAGDTFAHTLVNEFAGETFPAVGDILTDIDQAEFAVRHLLVEGYIGDATPGLDANPDRTTLPNGDVSDDSSPGVPMNAPIEWIYKTLVDRNATGAPSTERGPVIDFFYSLRDTLQGEIDSDPAPLEDALNSYNDTVALVESVFGPGGDCTFGSDIEDDLDAALDFAHDLVACPIALLAIGIQGTIDTFEAAFNAATGAVALAFDALVDAYLEAWVDDIDDGLAHWGELGLATSRGLFDPQTRRDGQNDECDSHGSETDPARIACEDAFGTVDAVLWASDDFINDHLLSMLGAPDFVGGLREALGDLSDFLDDLIGPALNPIRNALTEIKEFAKDKIKELLEDRFGIPITAIETLLESPSTRMDLQSLDLGALGTLDLFKPGDRAKLDGYLGLSTHAPFQVLGDDEAFTPANFEAFENTTVLARMLLLDGSGMDQLLSNLTGKPYSFYGADGPRGNVMTKALAGAGDDHATWLKLIDADFAWRSNANPLAGTLLPAGHPTGGHGNFPVWESCILRPSFRTLFDDWHFPGLNATEFPDLGDAVSTDPNDPAAAVTAITVGDPKFVDGPNTFVGGATPIAFNATDDYWSPGEIGLRIQVDGGPFVDYANGTTLELGALGLADGSHTLTVQAVDPCRTEAAHSVTVILDTTPPVVTYTEPALAEYDTDDLTSIAYTVSDGAGSGVASDSVTFDGGAATNGQVLDMFFLDAGTHTIVVTATDNVGNSGTTPRSFLLRATAESLRNNIDRALSLGLITNNGAYNGLVAKLDHAISLHIDGRHATEVNVLGAAQNQVEAKRGNGIEAEFADRLLGWLQDLIAVH
jgi:hypothetical protein